MDKITKQPISNLVLKTKTRNPKTTPDDEYQYIDISSVNSNLHQIENPNNVLGKDAPSRARKEVKNTDVLFATTRPNLKNIAIVEGDYKNPIASTGFCVLRADESKLNYKYLFYFLISEEVQKSITPFIKGAQYPAISDKDLLSLLIPLPSSVAEQKRIVSVLDELFIRIDKGIVLLQENIKNSNLLMGSVLDGIFDSVSKKYNEVSLIKHVKFIGGSQPPKSTFSYTPKSGYVRLIQIRDYKSDKHLVYIDEKKTKKFCNENDVMIGRYGPPVFQILRGLKGAYNVALMKAVPDEKLILKDYLFYFLMNGRIQNYIISISQRSAGQSGVNKKALEAYKIAIPPIEEQQRIVNKIKSAIPKIKETQELVKQNLENLNALKSSLLNQAFIGKL